MNRNSTQFDGALPIPILRTLRQTGALYWTSARKEAVLSSGRGENPNVGGAFGADTWHIGTFDEDGNNIPKLACLLRADGGSGQADDVVGFFPMSFKYTITICDPNDCPAP